MTKLTEREITTIIQKIVDHTNKKIVHWYELAKEDFGVIGAGTAHYNRESNEIVVEYTEDGQQKSWSMAFYRSVDYYGNDIDWVYKCWQELA